MGLEIHRLEQVKTVRLLMAGLNYRVITGGWREAGSVGTLSEGEEGCGEGVGEGPSPEATGVGSNWTEHSRAPEKSLCGRES